MSMKLLYTTQSPYKLISVYEDNGSRFLLLEGRDEIHSEWDPRHVLLRPVTEHYWNYLTLYALLLKKQARVLIIGLGAGTCARQMLHYRPDLHIEGIEVDQEIIEVGRGYFGLPDPVAAHAMDALQFLETHQDRYDYIVVDAFIHGNLGAQFTTRDFYALVKAHLNPGGIVAVNYLAERDWSLRVRDGVLSAFRWARETVVPGTYNAVVLASGQEVDVGPVSCPDEDTKRLKTFITKNMHEL